MSKRLSAYYGLPPVVQGAIVVVFGFLRTELSLSKTESWGLLAFYCLFIAWMLLETAGVTHVVPGA